MKKNEIDRFRRGATKNKKERRQNERPETLQARTRANSRFWSHLLLINKSPVVPKNLAVFWAQNIVKLLAVRMMMMMPGLWLAPEFGCSVVFIFSV